MQPKLHEPAAVDIPAPVIKQMFFISPDLIFSATDSKEMLPVNARSPPPRDNNPPMTDASGDDRLFKVYTQASKLATSFTDDCPVLTLKQ